MSCWFGGMINKTSNTCRIGDDGHERTDGWMDGVGYAGEHSNDRSATAALDYVGMLN